MITGYETGRYRGGLWINVGMEERVVGQVGKQEGTEGNSEFSSLWDYYQEPVLNYRWLLISWNQNTDELLGRYRSLNVIHLSVLYMAYAVCIHSCLICPVMLTCLSATH